MPPSLRFLRGLVISLMITMILGVITVVSLLVTRMPDGSRSPPDLPPNLALPAGTKAQAVTMGTGWIGVVTTDNRLLIFSPDGTLWQEVTISLPPAG